MDGLRILSSGVDTLHFSVRGELQDGLLVFLETLKREAQSSKELQVVTWGEQSLSVALRPHGWRSYPFWDSSPHIELAIGAPSPFPPVFIQTHSAYLHSGGADQAVAEISEWLAASVMRDGPVLGVSRLDLYCDTQGWSPAFAGEQSIIRGLAGTGFSVAAPGVAPSREAQRTHPVPCSGGFGAYDRESGSCAECRSVHPGLMDERERLNPRGNKRTRL